MKRELEEKLMNDYPELYAGHTLPPDQSLMCFGMEVGDGWYNIVECLSRCIKFHVDAQINHEVFLREILSFKKIFVGLRKGWYKLKWYKYVWKDIKEYKRLKLPLDIEAMQVRAVQVKEKFGGLRFYTDGSDLEVFGMISMAEMMSFVTCEHCGKPGNMHSKNGWLKTLCTGCSAKLKYHKNNS